jgi:hypothetical protein
VNGIFIEMVAGEVYFFLLGYFFFVMVASIINIAIIERSLTY